MRGPMQDKPLSADEEQRRNDTRASRYQSGLPPEEDALPTDAVPTDTPSGPGEIGPGGIGSADGHRDTAAESARSGEPKP